MNYFKHFLLLVLLFLFSFFSSHAQIQIKNRIWVGVEVQRSIPDVLSTKFRNLFLFPPSNLPDSTYLNSSSSLSEKLIIGLNASYGISNLLQVETGVSFRSFEVNRRNTARIEDIEFPGQNSRFWEGTEKSISRSYQTLQIPLRFRLNQAIPDTRFSIFANMGYVLGIHLGSTSISDQIESSLLLEGSFNTSTDTLVSFTGLYGINFPGRFYHLIETGVGFWYDIDPHLKVALNISYYHGIGNDTKISATLSSENTQGATLVRSTMHAYYGLSWDALRN